MLASSQFHMPECLKGYCGFSGFLLSLYDSALWNLCEAFCEDWNVRGVDLVAYMDIQTCLRWQFLM